MKFKSRINYSQDIIDAGFKRIKDIENFDFSRIDINSTVSNFVNFTKNYEAYIPNVFDVFNSFDKNNSLKNLKYFINISNAKYNKIHSENEFYKDYLFSLIRKLEMEALALDASIEEKEIKYFYGASTACYNNFTRENDFGLNEQNRDFMIDHKTKFFFEEEEKLSVIKNLGITLPIEGSIQVPIVDIEIVNELTTSGDTLEPIEYSNPLNMIHRNKTFNYSVLFKEMDNKRKYKREHATLCLLFKLGSVLPVNNMKLTSNSISSFDVESISYIDSFGEEIKINEYEIENTFESNYIFKPIETDTIILKIIQKTPIGTSVLKEKEAESLARIMEIKNFISGKSINIEDIEGYVYDISINSIEFNLLSFKNKGIYRSEYKETSNLNSVNFSISSVIPSLISIKDSYIKDYLILSEEVLTEKYFGLKVFNKSGGVLFNNIIPLIDNWNKQTEYLEPVGNIFRLKLFPLMHNTRGVNYISYIEEKELCITIEDQVEPKVDYIEPEEKERDNNLELIVTDDEYSADLIAELTESIADFVQESMDRLELEAIIIDVILSDIQNENLIEMVEGILDGYIGGFGAINIKDFIRDDGLPLPYDIFWVYEVQYNPDNLLGEIKFIKPDVGINLNLISPEFQARGAALNISNAYYNGLELNIFDKFKIYNNYQPMLLSNTSNKFSNISWNGLDPVKQLDETYLQNNIEEAASIYSRETTNTSNIEQTEYCTQFYEITFANKHEFKIGDMFDFYINQNQTYIRSVVSQIIDDYTIRVPKNYIGQLDSSLLSTDLSEGELDVVEKSDLNIEIFEETKRLYIGKDYLISPDNGSNWYDYIPTGERINNLLEKVTAGDFLIKYKNVNHNKFYVAKYFVKPYQSLTKDRKVLLKNKRVEIQKPLSEEESLISSIIIMRNGLKNKYLSPIIYEYNFYAFENKPKKIKKGLKYNKWLKIKNVRNTTNVN